MATSPLLLIVSISMADLSGRLRRMTRSQTDAEDAVQEIFIALWKAAARFDATKSSEQTFVAMVARRRLIDFGRRQRSAKQMPDTVSATAFDDDFVATQDTGPGDAMETCEEATQAFQILNQLPNEQSQAIKLSVFDGLTHKQIAENMSLPLGTIKTHIRRGLIKVRDRLAQPTAPANPGGEL